MLYNNSMIISRDNAKELIKTLNEAMRKSDEEYLIIKRTGDIQFLLFNDPEIKIHFKK